MLPALFPFTAEATAAHRRLEFLEERWSSAEAGACHRQPGGRHHNKLTEYTDMYPGITDALAEEKFDEMANWFETLAQAPLQHQPLPEGARRASERACSAT